MSMSVLFICFLNEMDCSLLVYDSLTLLILKLMALDTCSRDLNLKLFAKLQVPFKVCCVSGWETKHLK